MNTILAFCLLLVSIQLALASKKDVNPLLFFSQQTTNNCKTPGLQCKDCQTIQYCSSSNLDSLFEIRCEDQSRLRPYCDTETNTCVKDKPAVCELPETSFHCPGTGYYPDLEDCANYYICDENKVATKMSCPTGSNWVQGEQACTAGIYCRSYSPKLGQCKGKTNKLVSYAPDKNMYVLCLSNGPILFQCPNKWEIFDDAEVTCKFECTQNGFFPNPSDPRKFYSCTKEGKGYVAVPLECPEGYEFVELQAGLGICTLREITTTPATEAPATEAPATDAPATDAPATDAPATDAPATDAPLENNNSGEQIVEENLTENNQSEELEEHNVVEVENNNEVEQHVEEIEVQHNSENNNEIEPIEEHHSEEIVDQNNVGSNNSGDGSLTKENHELPAHGNEEITDETDDTDENNDTQLF